MSRTARRILIVVVWHTEQRMWVWVFFFCSLKSNQRQKNYILICFSRVTPSHTAEALENNEMTGWVSVVLTLCLQPRCHIDRQVIVAAEDITNVASPGGFIYTRFRLFFKCESNKLLTVSGENMCFKWAHVKKKEGRQVWKNFPSSCGQKTSAVSTSRRELYV